MFYGHILQIIYNGNHLRKSALPSLVVSAHYFSIIGKVIACKSGYVIVRGFFVEWTVDFEEPDLVARLQRQKGKNGNGQVKASCATVKLSIRIVRDYNAVNTKLITTVTAERVYADMRIEGELKEAWFLDSKDANRQIKVTKLRVGIRYQKGE